MFVASLACSCTYPSLLLRSLCPTFTSWSYQLKQLNRKKNRILASINGNSAYDVGGGYPELEQNQNGKLHSDMSSQREALLKGGDQVISVLEEIITLVCYLLLVIVIRREFGCVFCIIGVIVFWKIETEYFAGDCDLCRRTWLTGYEAPILQFALCIRIGIQILIFLDTSPILIHEVSKPMLHQ